MDKTKLKIDITEIWRALDRLETETDPNNRRVQDDIYRVRQRVYMIQNELGIVRDLADLKSEADQSPNLRTYPKKCPTCGELKTEELYCTKCGTWIPDEP